MIWYFLDIVLHVLVGGFPFRSKTSSGESHLRMDTGTAQIMLVRAQFLYRSCLQSYQWCLCRKQRQSVNSAEQMSNLEVFVV